MWIRRNELTGYVDSGGKELKHDDLVVYTPLNEVGHIYIHDAIEHDADGELTIKVVQISVIFDEKFEGDHGSTNHPLGQILKEYRLYK
jgi:hypothetical protein